MYQWIVFIHILAALAFFMAHGASAAMALRLRHERERERIKTLLELSNAAIPFAYIMLLVLLLAGIIAGVMGNWFSQGWIWASLALMVVLWFGMAAYARRFYAPLRKFLGLPQHGKIEPLARPATDADIIAAVRAGSPVGLLAFTFVVVGVILWMMMFKPF